MLKSIFWHQIQLGKRQKNPSFKRLSGNLQRANEDVRIHLGSRMILRSRLSKIYNHFFPESSTFAYTSECVGF